MYSYYVYILASRQRGAIYTGMTNDLRRRVFEHKNKITKGFTSRYNIHRLVYFEIFSNPTDAIKREKQLKNWHRTWKIELIEKNNPTWQDLFEKFNP